ncbi:NADPH-dependent FMN reductase [Microvirga brassicacearum]|uniref:NAD(P)H-dependent oxidoreductase n=1 Tax=Microvirga brassicacearum TaxID=2580413 RepID=A0A5N3P7W3_9HYPH|nr:NAD(P)H-dependent oxidoreductase [Microvirga brassicacearum]KAB0265812.1 NAD(P)H-dependent oxidoreductase [Microvirga brassicacearum]
MYKVAVFVGSLRRESINLQFAKALAKLGASKFTFHFVELGDVPLYNEDLWVDPPASVLRLKQDIADADAVLFVTPEYNRSIPAVIKNVVDWGTRPHGQNSWSGKPASIVGASPGNVGTAVAQAQLRSILVPLGLLLLGRPEVYFTMKPDLIDENHDIIPDSTRKFLQGYLDKFESWIAKVA